MAIFCDKDTKVLVQGMTGFEGRNHTARMLMAGTQIVGGVNPRKAGQSVDFDIGPQRRSVPVFGSVAEGMAAGATASVVFVPPPAAKAAMMEAIEAGLELVVVITEGIAVADTVACVAAAEARGTRLIGPNCPGIIAPGQTNLGIIPANITGPGPLGLVSKSGTLTYQMMYELRDLGFATCVGIGGDPVTGTGYIDALQAYQLDPAVSAVILIGEIGGSAEERAAEYIHAHMTKPVVAYVAGFTAPEGKTMGHAGAIISGSSGTAAAKKAAFEAAGVRVGQTPSQAAELLRDVMVPSRVTQSHSRL